MHFGEPAVLKSNCGKDAPRWSETREHCVGVFAIFAPEAIAYASRAPAMVTSLCLVDNAPERLKQFVFSGIR